MFIMTVMMMVPIAFMMMAVPQQGNLLEREKPDERGQHQSEQPMRIGIGQFKGFGQEVQ